MIYIEVINQLWDAGRTFIHDRKEKREFHKYLSIVYTDEVKKIAWNKRYQLKMAPLSNDYFKYKLESGLHTGQWIATGELINSLKVKGNYTIGFDNRRKHSSAHIRYIELARLLEYGTLKIPPRPLFRLVYIQMSKNIRYYYNNWIKLKGDI